MMVFSRGQKMLVVVTNEENQLVKTTVNVDGVFKDNTKLCDAVGDGSDCVTVAGKNVDVQIAAGGDPKVYIVSQ